MTSDNRHERRVRRFHALFAYSFGKNTYDPEFAKYIETFREHQAEIDAQIQEVAPEWPLDQMNRVDLSVLRVILLESKLKKTPSKVLIDEAVEIAKTFSNDSSAKLVNGVLGKILIDSN